MWTSASPLLLNGYMVRPTTKPPRLARIVLSFFPNASMIVPISCRWVTSSPISISSRTTPLREARTQDELRDSRTEPASGPSQSAISMCRSTRRTPATPASMASLLKRNASPASKRSTFEPALLPACRNDPDRSFECIITDAPKTSASSLVSGSFRSARI